MATILFITGTDTGVGKTVCSAVLIERLGLDGQSVKVMKPIETGCQKDERGELFPKDASLLFEVSAKRQTLEEVCPYRFSLPLSPMMAAKEEGASIVRDELVLKIKEQAADCDVLIVEGAGGFLVPVCEQYTLADVASDVNAKLVVVVGSCLGCLNHALLTFEAIGARRLSVLGYVFNELFRVDDRSERHNSSALLTNREALLALAGKYEIPELFCLPYLPEIGARKEAFLTLAERIRFPVLDT